MDKPKVLLSLPHMGSTHVANSMAVEDMLLRDDRVQLACVRPSAVPVENCLNQVIKRFLAEDWDYWINLDNDQAPTKNPIDLVFLDKDVIGMPTPAFKMKSQEDELMLYWAVYAWNENANAYAPYRVRPEAGPVQEVDAIGSGCWVVARRVLEAVSQPMLRQYDGDGVVSMGSDLSFCTKARAAGFQIYAHYDYPCRHYKTVDLLEVMRLLAQAKDK